GRIVHGRIHAAGCQLQIRVVDIRKQAQLGLGNLLLHEVDGGGAGFHGHVLAGQVFGGLDVVVIVGHQDGQAALVIGIGKIDDLFAVVADRDAGQRDVDVAGLQTRNDAVEVHRLKLVLQVQFLGDGGPQIGGKAGIGIALLELEGNEGRVGRHDQFLVLRGGSSHDADQAQAYQRSSDFALDHRYSPVEA